MDVGFAADLEHALEALRRAVDCIGPERVQIAPSCSLMHIPLDVREEPQLDPEIRSWLAFAVQKLREVNLLARALEEDSSVTREQFEENRRALPGRRQPPRVCDPAVRAQVAAITPGMLQRPTTFPERRKVRPRSAVSGAAGHHD
jgi:5-methyltetrahydropteroyltriglutamate--homocysteine methyltransferase